MKKIFLIIIVSLGISWLVLAAFNDIWWHPYHMQIAYIEDHNVVKGYPDGWFGPDRLVTRAELTKIVVESSSVQTVPIDRSLPVFGRANLTAHSDIGDRTNCFDDVGTQWYARYICYAYERWIIKWYGNGTFGPDDHVTFAQAFKIVLNSFGQWVIEGSGMNWYIPYANYIGSLRIFTEDVNPQAPISRGEMAALVYPFMVGLDEWKKTRQYIFGHQQRFESASMVDVVPQPSNTQISVPSSYETPTGPTNTPTSTPVSPASQPYSQEPRLWTTPWCVWFPPSQAPSTIMVNGTQRSIITSVWSRVDRDQPAPLIIAFHGRTNSNAQVRRYYDLEKASWGEAIIVYPLGLPEEGPSRSWRDGWDPSDQLRDFAFFDQIVDDFSQKYCLDKSRIYVVGHSLGARFSNSLACTRGNVIRAIGTVWWSTTINECNGSVAALIMHNPADRLASFAWGQVARDQLLRQNQCDETKTKPVGPAWWNCVEYTSCALGDPVVWCPHSDSTAYNGTYYPHTRPDDAGKYIWEFFEQHD